MNDQFSCLKWSMKLYFVTCKGSSLRSTSPLDAILAPSPSPRTNRTLQPRLLVERELGGTVRPLAYKRGKIHKARQEYNTLLQILPSEGAGKRSRVPVMRVGEARAGEVSTCPKSCSQTAGLYFPSVSLLPAKRTLRALARLALQSKTK